MLHFSYVVWKGVKSLINHLSYYDSKLLDVQPLRLFFIIYILSPSETESFHCRQIGDKCFLVENSLIIKLLGATVVCGEQYGRQSGSHPRQRYFRGKCRA